MKNFFAILMAVLMISAFGCTGADDQPTAPTMDQARDMIEDAGTSAADAAADAMEKADEALDSAGEAVGDAIDDLTGSDD